MVRTRKQGGSVRQLKSGRWAAYVLTATHGRESVEKGKTYSDRQSAQEALNTARALVVLGLWESRGEPAEEQKRPPRMETFGRFGEVYAATSPRLKPRTRENYFSLMRTALVRFKDMPLDRITAHSVDLWWRDLADRPVNRRNAYSAMRRIMKKAAERGLISESPCQVEGAFAMVAKDRPDHSREEFDAVLVEMPETLRPVLRALIASSGRIGEVVGLNVTDYVEGSFVISKQHKGEATKTNKTRTVPLLRDGLEAVDDYLAEHPAIGPTTPLFRSPCGERLTAARVRRAWVKACEAAGIEDFHLHDIRHIAGTEAAQAGLTTKDIMVRLGHSTMAAALRYQHSSQARQVKAAGLIDAMLDAKRG